MKNSRIEEFDLIKGLAIILMVWGHIGLPGTHFIYLFHMAVFFIVSVCVCKDKYSNSIVSLWQFIKNKIRTLYIPYVICAVCFTLFNNLFIKIGFYNELTVPWQSNKEIVINCVRALLFSRGTQIGGATWFLRALFFVSVFYAILEYLMKKKNIKDCSLIIFSIYLLLLCILYLTKETLLNYNKSIYYFISNYILGSVVFSFGVIFSRKNFFERIKTISLAGFYILCSISFLFLFSIKEKGEISITSGSFVSPLFFFIASFSGFIFLYALSSIVLNTTSLMKKIILLVGQNTLSVVLFHLLVFKICNLFFVKFFKLDYSLVSSFPTIYGYKSFTLWQRIIVGVGYVCIGVFFPVLLNILKKKLLSSRGIIHD